MTKCTVGSREDPEKVRNDELLGSSQPSSLAFSSSVSTQKQRRPSGAGRWGESVERNPTHVRTRGIYCVHSNASPDWAELRALTPADRKGVCPHTLGAGSPSDSCHRRSCPAGGSCSYRCWKGADFILPLTLRYTCLYPLKRLAREKACDG